MKTLTNHDALATKIAANPAGIWSEHPDGPQDVDAPILEVRINETDLPMNTFAPVDELDELDPDIPRPPDDAQAELDVERDAESVPARTPVARCADGNGTMVGLFFSDHVVDIARAKAMCALCPLEASCLAGALEREEPWGVWGGQLLSGGRVIADKRPCGRPPKVPRLEVLYDEMGPVGADLISALISA